MPHARNVAVSLGKWPARNNSLRQQVLKLKKSAFHGRAWARPKLLGMASRISRSLHILYASIRNVHTRLSDPEERLRARAHCFFLPGAQQLKVWFPRAGVSPTRAGGWSEIRVLLHPIKKRSGTLLPHVQSATGQCEYGGCGASTGGVGGGEAGGARRCGFNLAGHCRRRTRKKWPTPRTYSTQTEQMDIILRNSLERLPVPTTAA
mmetsp:Transcript_31002/g.88583  ORF Transcript_31002/g.88583 Transcript_31002/m.88583 type:complete len:206 (-) Transcript_31002:677-1294(-)